MNIYFVDGNGHLNTLVSHQFRIVGQPAVATWILWQKWFFWFVFFWTMVFTFLFNFSRLALFASLWASAWPAMVPVAPLALQDIQQKGNITLKNQLSQDTNSHWSFYLFFFTVRFRFFVFLWRTSLVLLIFFLSKVFFKLGWQNQVPLWFLSGAFSCLWAGSWKRNKDH